MSVNFQHGALITRDAREALLQLKKLVDGAAEKIRVAERETVGDRPNKRRRFPQDLTRHRRKAAISGF
jgi:hypothetical protein